MGLYTSLRKALSPSWLLGPLATAWNDSHGIVEDQLGQAALAAAKAKFPDFAANDALGRIAADRLLERGPAESDASFASRLKVAFDAWRWAGTKTGLLQYGLAPLLFGSPPTGLTNADTCRNNQFPGGALPYGDATKWARFLLVIAKPHPWTQRHWLADDWTTSDANSGWFFEADANPTSTLDSNASPAEVALVQRVVSKWRPAVAQCVGILVSFGSSTQVTGYDAANLTYTLADSAQSMLWDGA